MCALACVELFQCVLSKLCSCASKEALPLLETRPVILHNHAHNSQAPQNAGKFWLQVLIPNIEWSEQL